MLKFKDEDAEAVMAKALEGGSGSEKEEALFPEPIPIPALVETPGEALSSGEETPSKKQKVLFADEKCFHLHHCQHANPIQLLLYYLQ